MSTSLFKLLLSLIGSLKHSSVFAAELIFISGVTATALGQTSEDLPIPASFKTEGIPAIKKTEIQNLFFDPSEIRSNLIWDVDRKNRRMLVTDENNSVYMLEEPMAKPIRLTEGFAPNKVKISPDGTAFAYNSDHEDEDNYMLFVYDFKQKSSRRITVLTGKDESVDSFAWNRLGDSLLYVKVDYDTKRSKLCRNNFSAETCSPVDLNGVWTVVEAEGDKVLLRKSKASTNHSLHIYDLKTNKIASLEEQGDVSKGFLFGSKAVWVSEGNAACQSSQCIFVSDVETIKPTVLKLPGSFTDFDDVLFSPAGTNLLVKKSKNGAESLNVLCLKDGKIKKVQSSIVSGTYVIWNIRWLNDTEFAYTLENNGKPASIYSYEINTHKKTDWTKEKLPSQLADKTKSPEAFNWKSFDGREIWGYLVRPIVQPQRKKSPVLVFVHGGPQLIDKPVFSTQDIRFISNLGITIIHTNIRGSSGFGKEFMDADNGGKRGDAVKDVRALLDWVEKQPDLDAGQIFLRGESYGGFVVLSTALQEPSRIKGVIAEYPLVSIRGLLSQDWIDEYARNEYGDPKDENLMKVLDQLSPLNNSGRWNNIPLFLTRGKLDQRNPEKDVTDLKTQLQNKNSEIWFIYANEDGHGFSGKYVTAAMFKFLKTKIKKEQ